MSKTNRLINEKSPYLLQHAHNPVDWYPWGDEAFQKAKDEDKPIFLSIGYSTCYWCHVMEREVFENEAIAKQMNELFVNIKVDREERPDVDRVYMSALQAMTGSGGWPMSMFLTNKLKPFYGATYVPPKSKYGMPGFVELINGISEAWQTRRDEVKLSGEKIIEHIREVSRNKKSDTKLTEEMLLKGAEQYKNGFDEEYGGFGGAPKFPRPVGFNFLLRAYNRYEDNESLKMVIRTLLQMARGGVYDHLGGGFHRYSVDRFWRVPHFEKMLYDQAQLAVSYTEAYQLTGDKYFEWVANDILGYVNRVLTSPGGAAPGDGQGFYSAEDAESALNANDPHEKEEGAFYVWEKKEIDELLGEDAEIFNYCYGVDAYGNAPHGSDPHGVFTDKNILFIRHSVSEAANKFEKSTDEIYSIIEGSKKILFNAREKRPKCHLDDKILTSWNGLMISAFAKAYQVFGRTEYLEKAINASQFIIANLFDKNTGLLLHRFRDGEAKFSGTLEDYAFFTQGLIDLYESCFDENYLETAIILTEKMIKDFYDKDENGFFDTSGDDESILVRTKEDYDSAEPTGNSIAILNLARLSYILGREDWFEKAYNSALSFSDKMAKMPYAMPQMLTALEYILFKPKQIVVAGTAETAKSMVQEVFRRFMPGKVLICISPEKANTSKTFARDIVKPSDKTTGYVCENFACKLPVTTLEEFVKTI